MSKKLGVSIVMCCFNSADVLPQTLNYISKQRVSGGRFWEVIVVDNNSQDKTRAIAVQFAQNSRTLKNRLKVVSEKHPGISNARVKGFSTARYEIVSFVDDDNWLSNDWIERTAQIMEAHPTVGVCGGENLEPDYLVKPKWYEKYKECYAIGEQAKRTGNISKERGFVWGAGMSVRKSAWIDLRNKGFIFFLTGRVGKIKSAGEDSELCFALRLAGWQIWYDEKLKLTHAISNDRLNWKELRSMFRGFGAGRAGHDPYFLAELPEPVTIRERLFQSWMGQSALVIQKLLKNPLKLVVSFFFTREADDDILRIEHSIGRLHFLVAKRATFDRLIVSLRGTAG